MTRQSFRQRSTKLELIDSGVVSFKEFFQCLYQLEFINICTLAYRPTIQLLSKMWPPSSDREVFILDVGSGGGDMLRRIWAWSNKRGYKVKLLGADLNPWSKQSAIEMTKKNIPIAYETVDIFALNLEQKPDFIISSLFTHHLTDGELIKFIQWMDHKALVGWFINDLHRHPIAYYLIKFATRIIPTNRLIRNDAPLSVARSFTASDWRNLLRKAGIAESRARIIWFFPFRYGIACQKL